MEKLDDNNSFNNLEGFRVDSHSSSHRNLTDGKLENSSVFRNSFNRFNTNTFKFQGNKNPKMLSGGVPIGRTNASQVLVDNSDAHTLVMGATGSKKSRLVIMPSVYILGAAGESMIVSDPKAEIYNRTASYLKEKGYEITVINLRNPDTGNAWNPLAIPYSFYKKGDVDRAYEFANDVAFNLTQAEKDLTDPFWDNSAGDLFFGLTTLLFKFTLLNELPDDYVNLYNLLRLRRHLFKDYESRYVRDDYLKELIESDDIITGSLSGTITAPDKTKTSILSTFDEKMRCFILQPNLLDMLSNNSIDLKKNSEKKYVIFIIMPDEKTTYHKLVSLFIKQSYEYLIHLAHEKGSGKLPVRVNFILDEFSSLPTIKDFPNMISAARSRDIRFVLVIQSKHQLVQRYRDEAETIRSNCNNWIFLTSRELPLLSDISALCGKNKMGRDVVSVAALQHLNKEKGQVLVLSGRLLPFLTELADVSEYDNEKYIIFKPIKVDRQKYLLQNFDRRIDIKKDSTDLSDLIDYQKELEAKFDELFGPISEENM